MSKFLIGASTAAHQVEGNNIHSDSWAQEHMETTTYAEISGDAVDHYNRYKEDIDLLYKAGLNAFRFSIEWSRVEPEKGNFNEEAIEHYRSVLNCCHEKGVVPIVTLHHFTTPVWVISEGGWESESTVEYFVNYADYVVSKLGNLMEYICTINEANISDQIAKKIKEMIGDTSMLQIGINLAKYTNPKADEENMAVFNTKNPNTFLSPSSENRMNVVFTAHEKTRNLLKKKYPHVKVGITLSLHDFQYLDGAKEKIEKEWYEEFMKYLPYLKNDDFFGVQNYTRNIYGPNGVIKPDEKTRKTDMGYEFYPKSLGNVLRKVNESLTIPLLVTENGVATENDEDRVEFIQDAFTEVRKCVNDGINVIGYLHWSLLDNFEWQKGYSKRFGLIAVDRTTQKRYPKGSLSVLGKLSID